MFDEAVIVNVKQIKNFLIQCTEAWLQLSIQDPFEKFKDS